MPRHSFHIVILAFLFGVAVRTLVTFSPFIAWWLGVVALGLLVLGFSSRQAAAAPQVLFLATCLIALVVGVVRTDSYSKQFGTSPLQKYVGTTVSLHGVVIEEPDLRAKNQQVVVRVNDDKILVSTDVFADISYGDAVLVKGKLTVPKPFVTDEGRTFDYTQYLKAKKIEYTVSYGDVTVEAKDQGNKFIATLVGIKGELRRGIESVIREPQAGLGEGLLLGVKQALSKDIEEDFRTAGIVHIVVLSGYNIMLIVIFSLAILARFCSRRMRILIGMGLVASFALMVGLSATVVRASIMALLFLLAELLHRTYDIARSLLVAAALMVFTAPYILLFDIGFQLSFMATLGLIVIAPKLEALTEQNFGVKEYLVSTVATQIAVLPLLLYYIGKISIVAVLVNLLVLPVVPFAMLFTALSGVVALTIKVAAVPFAAFAEVFLFYIIAVARIAANLPFATVSIPEFSAFFIPVFYSVIGLWLWWWQNRKTTGRNLVAGWVIEDENECKAKVGAERSSAPTPVFFR